MTGNRTVAALVLAAGLSRRFGGDKLLHPLRGKPLAAHVADTIAGLPVTHRIAVCPANHPQRADLFARRGFEVVENTDPGRGMASSLVLGAERAMALDADALLVCLADMPFVTDAHLARLLAMPADAVATEADGVRSPPAVFARTMFRQLTLLTGDSGARELLKSATTVAAPPQMVRDFDAPSDFD